MTAKNRTKLKDYGRVDETNRAESPKQVSSEDRKREASQTLYLVRYE